MLLVGNFPETHCEILQGHEKERLSRTENVIRWEISKNIPFVGISNLENNQKINLMNEFTYRNNIKVCSLKRK